MYAIQSISVSGEREMETHNVRKKGGDRLHTRLGSTSDQNERLHSCMETCRMCAHAYVRSPQQQSAERHARAHTRARALTHTHTHGTLATMTLVKRTSMHRNTTRTQERWSSMSYAAERTEESAFAVIWGGAALVIPIHAGRLRI